MAATTTLILAGVGAAASLLGGVQQYGAQRAQAEYADRMADLQGQLDEMRARSTIAQGDAAISDVRRKSAMVEGSQIATAAAQGIRSDTGSMGAIREESRLMALQDEMMIRNNAALEAMGIRTQSALNIGDIRMRAEGARRSAAASLLGGGLDAARIAMGAGRQGEFGGQPLPQNPRPMAMNYQRGAGSNIA